MSFKVMLFAVWLYTSLWEEWKVGDRQFCNYFRIAVSLLQTFSHLTNLPDFSWVCIVIFSI